MATKFWKSTSDTSFNTAGNWSDTAAPANGDTLIFDYRGTASVTTNLGTILTGITIRKMRSYTGQIGVLSGSTATYLVLDGGTVYYEQETGQGSPTGSNLCLINFGSTAGVVYLFDSADESSNVYLPPLLLKGTDVTVYQSGGSFGFAALTGETGTLTALRIADGAPNVAPNVYIGPGATVTLIEADLGTILSQSSNTTAAAKIAGTTLYKYEGSGAHTTLSIDEDGQCLHEGAGAITTLNLSGTFTRRGTASLTITNANLYEGYTLDIDNGAPGSTVFTNAPAHVRCSHQDGKIIAPVGITV
jgi:hypothetical protein